jgi:signal transduction histidine kinase
LQDAGHTWTAITEQQHKQFVIQLPEREMLLFADGDRLHQVFSNVIGNAFKYTPPGGTITLTASIEGERAVVSVADEGEGIVPEQLPHIFDLFQRATTTGSGLGVGLAVVKALVTAHDGSVTAASEGLGRGTVITIHLPLSETQVTTQRRRPLDT